MQTDRGEFYSFHPAVLLCYFLSVLLITMFTVNPVFLILSLTGSLTFCATLSRAKEFFKSLALSVPLFLLITITNPLFSHNGATSLFFLEGNAVTLEALLFGADIAVMVTAVVYWCRCITHVMTSDKILYLFGKAIPKLSLVLSMALRFLPLFLRQYKKILQVHKAMDANASKRLIGRIKTGLRVFSAVVTWSMENAMETAASMKARGYGIKGRSIFSAFRFTLRDGLMMAAVLLLDCLTAAGLIGGDTGFSFYPRVTPVLVTPLSILSYAAFGLCALLPFILEGEGAARWRYFRSRI